MVARKSKKILVKGIVQGVGFRPFIYNLATSMQIAGYVCNTGQGVEIKLEAEQETIERFLERMQTELPPLAEIIDIVQIEQSSQVENEQSQNASVQKDNTDGGSIFRIVTSYNNVKGEVRIPTDVKTCSACQLEINDCQDRHYYYPLTNCTNCGPRYTVIRDVPYDRPFTTMSEFLMCTDCQAEYDNPSDRRFHAQPTACPNCGPVFSLLDQEGKELFVAKTSQQYVNLFAEVASRIDAGQILAIKGVGGFHFVCDADNHAAVQRLRNSKNRPYKPLAVMAKTLATVKNRLCLSDKESQLLTSSAAPIVILDKKENEDFTLIAPHINSVGVMLAYAPLHHLLFNHLQTDWLVMTSANLSNMPIAIDNQQARSELSVYVDSFLIHEREIVQSCDDSVIRVVNGVMTFIRRGRGYTPATIKAPMLLETEGISVPTLLAVGGEMKNSLAYLQGDNIILSQHIGEIDSLEGRHHFLHVAGHIERLFNIEPQAVAYDKHPSYQISEVARLLPYQLSYQIQHHHAHMASCMAEHQVQGQVLAIILDGTGYGDDGNLWGCEFLVGDYQQYKRVAHGDYLPVVGGERAIREPWRMAVALLFYAQPDTALEIAIKLWPNKIREIEVLLQMLQKNIQITKSSGMGRLFDGVAALLGYCEVSSYEGEAAIRLSAAAERAYKEKTQSQGNIEIIVQGGKDKKLLNWQNLISKLTADMISLKDKQFNEKKIEQLALAFIDSLSRAIVKLAIQLAKSNILNQVVLSGGTWHNEILLRVVVHKLEEAGLQVYYQQKLPTNDGGLAVGQAVIAAAKNYKERGN